jgi:hypothetical protein
MGNVTLAGATSGQITLAPTAVAGTNTITLPAATGTVAFTASPTFTGTTTVSNLTLAAGTASLAPEVFTSGTNLTSAIAGAVEYDGKVFYGTPQGTQRGVIPGQQFYRLNADFVGTTAATAQNLFGVGVTLSSSTVYAFEIEVGMIKTAGATSHTLSLSFAGAATLNNIFYTVASAFTGTSTTVLLNTSTTLGYVSTAAATVISQAVAAAASASTIIVKGTVSVNAGGTFTPQYTQGSTGAYSTVAGSYMNIYPISTSGANTSVGAWA